MLRHLSPGPYWMIVASQRGWMTGSLGAATSMRPDTSPAAISIATATTILSAVSGVNMRLDYALPFTLVNYLRFGVDKVVASEQLRRRQDATGVHQLMHVLP